MKIHNFMKTQVKIFLTALLFITTNIKAQDSQIRKTGEFSSFTVIGNIRVEIYQAESPSLELFIKGAPVDDVITENKEGDLSIRLKTSTPSDAEVKVKLFFTDLEKLNVQAQALVVSPDTLRAKSMVFESRAGGKMELMLRINSIEADVRQGGILVFYGEVDDQNINVSSGGTYSGFDLKAKKTKVTALAGGKAKVTALESIDATANAKGYVGYKGEPARTSVKSSLGGEIVHLRDGSDI